MEGEYNEELNSMMRSVSKNTKNMGVFDLTPEPIHSGRNGNIFHMVNRIDKKPCVLKVIWKKVNNIKSDKRNITLDTYQNEKKIHQSLRSRYVLELINTFQDQNNFYFIFQYCSNGSIRNYINKGMSMDKVKDIGLKIAKAISSIHKLKVIHGDLKPENILITENDEVKICDFASSIRFKEGQKVKGFRGTIGYTSPESIEFHDEKHDIWSYGCILYEMIIGKLPFQYSTWKQLTTMVTEEYLKKVTFDPKLSSQLVHLFKRIFVYEPSKRIRIDEIIGHYFFTNEPLPQQQKNLKKQIKKSSSVKFIRQISDPKLVNKQNMNGTNIQKKGSYKSILASKENMKQTQKCGEFIYKSQTRYLQDLNMDTKLNYNVKNGLFEPKIRKNISPLKTYNMVIKPIKLKKKTIKIDKDGLTVDPQNENQIWFNISSDGNTIKIKNKKREKVFTNLVQLPQKYYHHYQECKQILKRIQSDTAKYMYSDQNIEIKIMFDGKINVQFDRQEIINLYPQDIITNKKNIPKDKFEKIKSVYYTLLKLGNS